jgi:hypothetical protein
MTLLAEMRALLGEERARVVAPHRPVIRMKPLPPGKVTVRAWWNARDNAWEALEGSHRLALAMTDGVPVEIIPVKLTDVFPNRNPDGSDIYGDPGYQVMSVADALETFRNWGPRPTYELEVVVRGR